jgi:hypothetical protein
MSRQLPLASILTQILSRQRLPASEQIQAVLSGFQPGHFQNFQKICLDWETGSPTIIRGPAQAQIPKIEFSGLKSKQIIELSLMPSTPLL